MLLYCNRDNYSKVISLRLDSVSILENITKEVKMLTHKSTKQKM